MEEYYQAQALAAQRAHAHNNLGAPQDLPSEAPLTMMLREANDMNISSVARTYNTLSEVRNRLLGYPPPSPVTNGSNATAAEPSSFADAMRRSGQELAVRLSQLENLAEELSARL